MSLPVNFRFIFGEISAEKKFSAKILLHQKIRLWILGEGGLLSYFWAIVLISAVISILGDFGSLLPTRTVTVKLDKDSEIIPRQQILPSSKGLK